MRDYGGMGKALSPSERRRESFFKTTTPDQECCMPKETDGLVYAVQTRLSPRRLLFRFAIVMMRIIQMYDEWGVIPQGGETDPETDNPVTRLLAQLLGIDPFPG